MQQFKIDSPHGYLHDKNGRVVLNFANFNLGNHQVDDSVRGVTYIEAPNTHPKSVHWIYNSGIPPVTLSVDSGQINNDGTDETVVSMTLDANADSDRQADLIIGGKTFDVSLVPGEETIETITTTARAGTVIEIEVNAPDVQRATTTVEVVNA